MLLASIVALPFESATVEPFEAAIPEVSFQALVDTERVGPAPTPASLSELEAQKAMAEHMVVEVGASSRAADKAAQDAAKNYEDLKATMAVADENAKPKIESKMHQARDNVEATAKQAGRRKEVLHTLEQWEDEASKELKNAQAAKQNSSVKEQKQEVLDATEQGSQAVSDAKKTKDSTATEKEEAVKGLEEADAALQELLCEGPVRHES